ncbi:hypothetical protein ANO11243_002690 [Dothideomycetidae sp. 11243]|nr:hypothetical protein ANO11243_002690 [fungal sp. No.11243]
MRTKREAKREEEEKRTSASQHNGLSATIYHTNGSAHDDQERREQRQRQRLRIRSCEHKQQRGRDASDGQDPILCNAERVAPTPISRQRERLRSWM